MEATRGQCYTFKVGQVDCTVMLDGAWIQGAAAIVRRFPQANEAAYRAAYAALGLDLDAAATSFNVFALRIEREVVLIDSGEGGRPHGGHLPESLSLAGIAPETVTLVVITHSHGDHVLGLLGADGTPVFPHATYVISAPELQFWQAAIRAGHVDHGPTLAMIEARGLRVIAMDEEIRPGLTAVALPGHTPGHIGLLLESDGERLLHLADLLHSPMQFAHPAWSPTFDVDTNVSVPTRRAALSRAADDQLLTLLYHLPFPGLGHVRHQGDSFAWEPIAD